MRTGSSVMRNPMHDVTFFCCCFQLTVKVGHNGSQQEYAENGRSNTIVVGSSFPVTDLGGAPVEGIESIQHDTHSNKSEQDSRQAANTVAKVEKTHRQATQHNSKIEPR